MGVRIGINALYMFAGAIKRATRGVHLQYTRCIAFSTVCSSRLSVYNMPDV